MLLVIRGEARPQNVIKQIFLWQIPLSRFIAQILRVNKTAMKSFAKIYRPESTVNKHNIYGVRSYVITMAEGCKIHIR